MSMAVMTKNKYQTCIYECNKCAQEVKCLKMIIVNNMQRNVEKWVICNTQK